MKLHHVGIVVPRIADSLGELKRFMTFQEVSLPMAVGTRKVNVCFLSVGQVFLELIEPTSSESAVADFASSGGGIHHLCFEVDDIEGEVAQAVSKGAALLVSPEKGFDERRIAFVDLKTETKLGLVEFIERKKG